MDLNIHSPLPERRDWRIGCIGSGFIMSDCHLVAYRKAGFNPVAIASRTRENAAKCAVQNDISKVYDSIDQLLEDESIEVLDIFRKKTAPAFEVALRLGIPLLRLRPHLGDRFLLRGDRRTKCCNENRGREEVCIASGHRLAPATTTNGEIPSLARGRGRFNGLFQF